MIVARRLVAGGQLLADLQRPRALGVARQERGGLVVLGVGKRVGSSAPRMPAIASEADDEDDPLALRRAPGTSAAAARGRCYVFSGSGTLPTGRRRWSIADDNDDGHQIRGPSSNVDRRHEHRAHDERVEQDAEGDEEAELGQEDERQHTEHRERARRARRPPT